MLICGRVAFLRLLDLLSLPNRAGLQGEVGDICVV